ncbi:MAG: hypothetical protein GY725_25345 [bacterium]|nr:hypothetical protein [bacterium]
MLTLLLSILVSSSVHAELLDGVAAIVGEDVILRSELDEATDGAVQQIREQNGSLTPKELRVLRRQALQSLIDERLISQITTRRNLNATPAEIDQAIVGIAADEGTSVDRIYEEVAGHGLAREAYRKQIGKQLTHMKLISSLVQQQVSVSDEEILALFEKRYGAARPGNRLSVLHILIPVSEEATATQRTAAADFAQRVRQQAIESGNFGGLARAHSAAPSARENGLTVFVQRDAPIEILAALEGLEPGGITEIVETGHGLNLFQFLESVDPSTITLAQVQDKLRAELMERKSVPEFKKWLDDIRETRYIEVMHPDLK